MADDLLDQLARAIGPGAVEPPPERVRALRNLVVAQGAVADRRRTLKEASRGNGADPAASDGSSLQSAAAALAGAAPYWPVAEQPAASDRAGEPVQAPQTVPPLAEARSRRRTGAMVPRVLSGAMAAAAVAILVAMVAVQDLPRPLREVAHGVGLPVDSTELVAARHDVEELALALARRDGPGVAGADAAMLRSTSKLGGNDLKEVSERAVKLHVEALAFLRDNPSPEALSDLPSPDYGTGEIALPPPAALSPGQAPPAGPVAPTHPPVPRGSTSASQAAPPFVPPEPPTVAIRSISPLLDATFKVDFEVSGFTLGAGQPYSVQFSFDAGQEPTIYNGPPPWRFPLLKAVKYHRLCAVVVDSVGAAVPDSGNCADILLL